MITLYKKIMVLLYSIGNTLSTCWTRHSPVSCYRS